MTRKELIKKALEYIANNDEYGNIIPDGLFEEGSILLADFAQHILLFDFDQEIDYELEINEYLTGKTKRNDHFRLK